MIVVNPATCQRRVIGIDDDGAWGWHVGGIPDLTDPATLGCLLALVREAYPKHTLWVAPVCVEDPLDDTEFILDEPRAFTVMGASEVSCYVTSLGRGQTEAEALVAALETAE